MRRRRQKAAKEAFRMELEDYFSTQADDTPETEDELCERLYAEECRNGVVLFDEWDMIDEWDYQDCDWRVHDAAYDHYPENDWWDDDEYEDDWLRQGELYRNDAGVTLIVTDHRELVNILTGETHNVLPVGFKRT